MFHGKDLDFELLQITVRDAKGEKDRLTGPTWLPSCCGAAQPLMARKAGAYRIQARHEIVFKSTALPAAQLECDEDGALRRKRLSAVSCPRSKRSLHRGGALLVIVNDRHHV